MKKGVVLRELSRRDLPVLNEWRHDHSLVDLLGAPYRMINPETDKAWFERYQSNRSREVRCAIVAGGKLEGLVSLTGIDTVHRSAEYHIMIGSATRRRKGVGSAATIAILEHGFRDLNLHRIHLSVLDYNVAAIRFYEKTGFVREGRMREAAWKNGRYHDLILMGLLQREFAKRHGAT